MMAQVICFEATVSFGFLAHRAGVLLRLRECIAFATQIRIPLHGARVVEIFLARTAARSASVAAPNGGLQQLLIGALELRAGLLCATDGAI